MREISSDHHDEHRDDDHDGEDDEHDGEDDDDNDGTATLPMTHACVKLLPPMPSQSLLSWLPLLLSSHPIRHSGFLPPLPRKWASTLALWF